MKYVIQSFGCKSNQYESQAIREILNRAGNSETDALSEAGLYLINTCGVTGRAAASCRNAIRKAARANPGMIFCITGCSVDLGEEWPELPGGRPILVPNAKKHAIADMIRAHMEALPSAPAPDEPFALSISSFQGRTRAFLKIQDGCDNFCTYCAVPHARGAPRSRPKKDILDEAARLVRSGHRELALTGINIGAYRDGTEDLAGLLAALSEVRGIVRLRLGSVEPPFFSERLARAMREHETVCPHVHLPLQSGADSVLAAMGRRYTASEFLEKVAMIREELTHPSVTTDVIVGFPGEDAAAFEKTCETCRLSGFSRLHVFPFSARPGTPASSFKRTVPDRVVEGWKSALIEIGEDLARRYAEECVGLEERVIVESGDGGASGLSDRYMRVRLPDALEVGAVVRVSIAGNGDGGLDGMPARTASK
jgi:MiaB-like tRNA modifying enzyme